MMTFFLAPTIRSVSGGRIPLLLLVAGLLVLPTVGLTAQAVRPTRTLGTMERQADSLLASVSVVQELSGGRVLVHDVRGRRVVFLDSSLKSVRVVADNTIATGRAYASVTGGIIPTEGDSSLFVDPSTLSMFVIGADGAVGRVMALPPSARGCFLGGTSGRPTLDASTHVVCRMPPERLRGKVMDPGLHLAVPEIADSSALVRFDLSNRRVDTITFLQTGKRPLQYVPDKECDWFVAPIINPLPLVDDWAAMHDGTVAVIRGADYHIDWISPAGERRQSPRIGLPSTRLSDSAKSAYLDSTKAVLARLQKRKPGADAPAPVCDPSAMRSLSMSTQSDVTDDPTRMVSGSGRAIVPLLFVPAEQLPDYVPPFAPGSALADRKGRLWIRRLEIVNGGSVYDVVDRESGKAIRTVVPKGRVIAGFGQDGRVYTGVTEADGVRLERYRVP